MNQKEKKSSLEIRFTGFSFMLLMVLWTVITILAFILGVFLGVPEWSQEEPEHFFVPEEEVVEKEQRTYPFEDLTKPNMELKDLSLLSPKDLPIAKKKEQSPVSIQDIINKSNLHHETNPKEVISPEPFHVVKKKQDVSHRRVVQIASFREEKRAEFLVLKLKKKGYSCFSNQVSSSDGQTNLYRVFVGPFSDNEQAEKVQARLEKQEGFKNMLIIRFWKDKGV